MQEHARQSNLYYVMQEDIQVFECLMFLEDTSYMLIYSNYCRLSTSQLEKINQQKNFLN